MKVNTFLLSFTAAALAIASPLSSTPDGPRTSNSFPKVNGLHFEIDGKTQYYAGSNSYWIPFLTDNQDVDHVMSDLQKSGLKVLRVWGFNDVNTVPSAGTVWFQLLQSGNVTINTGPDGLQRLDYVVKSAEAHDVKLIINFVNNWSDYGGIAAYNAAFGGNATTWYTIPEIQSTYRAYIKAVMSRYTDSPAIFAWELANEPRCHGCPTSVITNWVASTSKYIKSLDPKHMVCIGDEGFGLNATDTSYPYTTQEGLDFAANLAIPTIDFGTLHLYPIDWGENLTWGSQWVSDHGKACTEIGKPCILEEFGSTTDKCTYEPPWQKTALESKGISGDQFWQMGDTLSTGLSPDDGYTVYIGTGNWTCVVTDHVKDVNKANRALGYFG